MLLTRRPPQAGPVHSEGRALARGRRTVLREFCRADIDRWLEWPEHSDPLFESYNPPALSAHQRDLYFNQRSHSRDGRQFSVEDLEGDLIGRISLRDMNPDAAVSVLGISMHPRKLGQGLGTDALATFLGYYFGEMQMQAIFLDVAAFNYRARRVYEKCGFRACGQRWGDTQPDTAGIFRLQRYAELRPLFHWERGMVRPLLVDMALRRGEWERLREAP